jgi:hypothetical protein
VFEGATSNSLAARASAERGPFSSTAFVERTSLDGLWKVEGMARFAPVNRVAFSGPVSQFAYDSSLAGDDDGGTNRLSMRGEAALRLGQLWLGAGAIVRDEATLPALRVFDDSARVVTDSRATGVLGTARGRLFRSIYVDAYGVAWDESGPYRPRYQARTQAYLQTTLPNRFPSGNFGLLFAVTHDYRSAARFPVGTQNLATPGRTQSLSALLEIRIVSATLSYQLRNAVNARNQYVPFFQAPQTTSVYGVRWEFWN